MNNYILRVLFLNHIFIIILLPPSVCSTTANAVSRVDIAVTLGRKQFLPAESCVSFLFFFFCSYRLMGTYLIKTGVILLLTSTGLRTLFSLSHETRASSVRIRFFLSVCVYPLISHVLLVGRT